MKLRSPDENPTPEQRFVGCFRLAARQVGSVARHLQGRVKAQKKSGHGSPEGEALTVVDLTAQEIILHALLAIFTAGLWLPIWLLIAVTSRESRVTYTLHSDGMVRRTVPDAKPKSWWGRNYGWVIGVTVAVMFVLLIAAGADAGA